MKTRLQQNGFTLLEMVLVLLIMGMVASMSVAFIDNEDNQLRYETSLHKLTLLRDAVIKEREYQNQVLLSGFVVDNGVLPPSGSELQALIAMDGAWNEDGGNNWLAYTALTPRYKILTGETYADVAGITVNKGYRGSYIASGLDSNNSFNDGWGDTFTLATSANDLDLGYSAFGKPGVYGDGNDIDRDVNSFDWSVPLSTFTQVKVVNRTGTDIINPTYKLAMVIFRNDAVASADDRWHTFHATVDLSSATIIPDDNATVSGLSWLDEDGNDASTERVPVGKVVIVLVDNSNHSDIKAKSVMQIAPRYALSEITLSIQ